MLGEAGACPTDNDLATLLDGSGTAELHRHVSECASCRGLMAQLLRSLAPKVPAPESGRTIGGYLVGGELGRGGMGVVFRATDTRLRRPVALKFLASQLVGDPDAALRFRREAQAAAALRHPNVAALYEAGESEGLHYLAFELVDGVPLSERIGDGLPERDALPLLTQFAAGVAAAHAGGIVHRDLKPSNVMVQPDGTVKLLDFGLAKLGQSAPSSLELLTLSREVLGTLAYMAPEQQLGHADDPRVDVWAIGAVAYHLLSGHPPFGSTPTTIARAQLAGAVPPLEGVSADLATVVMRCLSEDPARRPATAQLVTDDLARIARGEPIVIRPSSVAYRWSRTLLRHRALTAVSLVALAAVATLGVYGLSIRRGAAERARLARELGRSAPQIRATLRNAWLLPLHDTRPELALVARQMELLARDVRAAGREGEAAGHAALGEGWAALGDHTRARVELEEAWRLGEHAPEVAAALGSSLAALYEEQDQKARHIADLAERQRQRDALDRSLRQPALGYLGAAGGAADPSYAAVAARLALLERDYPRALTLGETAFARSPSAYEAGLVASSALYALGNDTWRGKLPGGHARARELWARMREIDDRVLDIARSDEATYEAVVKSELDAALVIAIDRNDVSPLEERLVALAGKAITARPDSARAERTLARVLYVRGQDANDLGKDPQPFADASAAASRRALELDPADVAAARQVGNASFLVAQWRLGRGEDPEAPLDAALAAYEKAQAMAEDPETLRTMGMAYAAVAEWRLSRGHDPLPACERAIALERRSQAHNGEHDVERTIGEYLVTEASWLDHSGGDPLPKIAAAIDAFRKGQVAQGSGWELRALLADALADEALYRVERGTPVGDLMTRARAELAAADPEAGAAYPHAVLQRVAAVEAMAALVDGRDPRPWEAEVRAAGARARAADPRYADASLGDARIALLAARADELHGASPKAALERARIATERCTQLDGGNVNGLVVAAEVRRRLAEWALAHHRSPDNDLTAARALLERAMRNAPELAHALGEQAALDRVAAAATHDPALLDRARSELAKARTLNPRVDFLDERLGKR